MDYSDLNPKNTLSANVFISKTSGFTKTFNKANVGNYKKNWNSKDKNFNETNGLASEIYGHLLLTKHPINQLMRNDDETRVDKCLLSALFSLAVTF